MGNGNLTLYTGVTSNLIRRIREHKEGKKKGFTQKYKLKKCFYFEFHENMREAIIREKQIKNYSRSEKLALIRIKNPVFADMASDIFSYVDDPLSVLTYHEANDVPYLTPGTVLRHSGYATARAEVTRERVEAVRTCLFEGILKDWILTFVRMTPQGGEGSPSAWQASPFPM